MYLALSKILSIFKPVISSRVNQSVSKFKFMSNIKNLSIISDLLTEPELKELDNAAAVHLKQSNIEFTIVSFENNVLIIETEQGKTSGNYANYKTLVKRTGEVFQKLLPSSCRLEVNAKRVRRVAGYCCYPRLDR